MWPTRTTTRSAVSAPNRKPTKYADATMPTDSAEAPPPSSSSGISVVISPSAACAHTTPSSTGAMGTRRNGIAA